MFSGKRVIYTHTGMTNVWTPFRFQMQMAPSFLFYMSVVNKLNSEEKCWHCYLLADMLYENRPLLFKVLWWDQSQFPLSANNSTCVKEMECIDSTRGLIRFVRPLFVEIINLNKSHQFFDFKNTPSLWSPIYIAVGQLPWILHHQMIRWTN